MMTDLAVRQRAPAAAAEGGGSRLAVLPAEEFGGAGRATEEQSGAGSRSRPAEAEAGSSPGSESRAGRL